MEVSRGRRRKRNLHKKRNEADEEEEEHEEEEQEEEEAEAQSGAQGKKRRLKEALESTVMVWDLEPSTTADHLTAFFQNYGDVLRVRLVPEQAYALVTFQAREIAQGVIVAMGGKEGFMISGIKRKVRVSWAASGLPAAKVSTNNSRRPRKKHWRHQQGLPCRCKSRLFTSAVASAVASATGQAITKDKTSNYGVRKASLPDRQVIAYDDWL